MLSLFAIPIVSEAVTQGSGFFDSAFFARPIDVIFFDFFIWFGWIPIAITLFWGFIQMWVNYKQGIYSASLKFVLLAIDVPSQTEQTPKALENLFANIYGCKSSLTWKEKWIGGRFHPSFSFEIISSEGYIQFLVRTQIRFRDIIEAGIYAHYPDAEISEVEDYTKKFPKEFPNNEYEMWGAEFTTEGPSYLPIRTYVDFEDSMTQEIKDPLGFTLEQMAKMRPGEHFWIQFVVQPSTNDWTKEGSKRINEIYGIAEKRKKGLIEQTLTTLLDIPSGVILQATDFNVITALFGADSTQEDDPFKAFKLSIREIEEAKAILRKSSKVGMGLKTRILYIAKKDAYAKLERTGIVKGILNQFSNLNFNKFTLFIPQVPKDDYFWMRWAYTKRQRNLMRGYCGRSMGMGAHPKFFNAEELASLWHFPTISIKAPLIRKSESKRAEPPFGLPFTFEENTLPGFLSDNEDVPHLPVAPPISHDLMSQSGLPVAPTGTTTRGELPIDLQTTDKSIEARTDSHSQIAGSDLMPPQDLLPNLTSPTKQKQSAVSIEQDKEEEEYVPTNLPV